MGGEGCSLVCPVWVGGGRKGAVGAYYVFILGVIFVFGGNFGLIMYTKQVLLFLRYLCLHIIIVAV